jgi:adenosylcobinamide amidohydrolase
MASLPQLITRDDGGISLSTLVWRLPEPLRCVSTAAIGGGITDTSWVVNAEVAPGYRRTDLEAHGAQIARAVGLAGRGVVMLTAVDVRHHHVAEYDGVSVTATVGVREPTWAADPAADARPMRTPSPAGTVNVVMVLPAPVAVAGLVNLVATVTEAKCQAFAEFAVPGTGTASDAVTVLCPLDGDADPFGGPRSRWGAPAARATYDVIAAGLRTARC